MLGIYSDLQLHCFKCWLQSLFCLLLKICTDQLPIFVFSLPFPLCPTSAFAVLCAVHSVLILDCCGISQIKPSSSVSSALLPLLEPLSMLIFRRSFLSQCSLFNFNSCSTSHPHVLCIAFILCCLPSLLSCEPSDNWEVTKRDKDTLSGLWVLDLWHEIQSRFWWAIRRGEGGGGCGFDLYAAHWLNLAIPLTGSCNSPPPLCEDVGMPAFLAMIKVGTTSTTKLKTQLLEGEAALSVCLKANQETVYM